jgi:hypothetical protein
MLNKCNTLLEDKLVKLPANKNTNYWSPLSCLVKEQEEEDSLHTGLEHLMLVTTDHPPPPKQNKTATKWKQKIASSSGIMDTGCTSGIGAGHSMYCFHDTGLLSEKVFMLPDKTQIKATNKMILKHNLWPGASKVNIVPNLYCTLISIPKIANAKHITVFDKDKASVYIPTTTTLTASKDPLFVAPRCHRT